MGQMQLDILPNKYELEARMLNKYGTGVKRANERRTLENFRGRLEKHAFPKRGQGQGDRSDADNAVPRRILIVDDEPVVALGLQEGLEGLPNCEVAVATCSTQALQLFEQQSFDLLITDYKMPDTDGMALATHVRPIIMITAHASDALREQAARVSIQRVLDKPVELAEIRSVTLGALDR
jgi:CheY-like chemotaxis protein